MPPPHPQLVHPNDDSNLQLLLLQQEVPGNDCCLDCNAQHPTWCSVTFGIVFCTRCSSRHRALGTTISHVKSLELDDFSPLQLAIMKAGGNRACLQFFRANGVPAFRDLPTTRDKYTSDQAQLYQLVLLAKATGKPIPTTLQKSSSWQTIWQEWNEKVRLHSQLRMKKIRQSVPLGRSDIWLVAYFLSMTLLLLMIIWFVCVLP